MKAWIFILAVWSSWAQAIPATVDVRIDRYTYPPIIVHAGGREVHAGQYLGVMDRAPITAWCAELEQFLQFGTVQQYDVLAAVEVYDTQTALRLDQLLSWTNQNGQPKDAIESADIQVDIWRILSGSDPIGDYTAAPITVQAVLLHHANRQDLVTGYPLIAVPVGEPTPAIPLSLGVGFLCGYLATRRKP